MTPEQLALSLFRQPPRCLNCAQTVCAAMGREDLVEFMKDKARGNAPGGVCGALFAAMTLAPDRAQSIRKAFAKELGADTCAALKEKRNPCPHCVTTAIRRLTDAPEQGVGA